MDIEKSLRIAATPERVWALLLDPQAMAACVPGMQSVEVISPDEYAALMHVKIAFVSARFKLRTRIVERREPLYLKAEGTGEDASVASSLKQVTELSLTPHADGGTDLQIKVHVDLLGRMGSFGLSVMKTKADRLWDEFGVNLAAKLNAEPAAQAVAAQEPPLASSPLPTVPNPASDTPAHAKPSPQSGAVLIPEASTAPPTAQRGWWAGVLQALGIQPAGRHDIIVIEVQRADQSRIRVEWPAAHAQACLSWLRELDR